MAVKPQDFAHLHVHSYFSVLDGMGSPEDIAKRAAEIGSMAVAITDHGNIDASIRLQAACLSEGIVSVIGCEFYITDDIKEKNPHKHMCVFVRNEAGWNNLLRMLTIANMDGFYRRPRIDPQTFLNNCEGLVVSTACLGSFLQADWGKDFLLKLKDELPGDVYLEIMPHVWKNEAGENEQEKFNSKLLKFAVRHDLPIIATNDAHYMRAEDARTQEIMLAIRTRAKMSDAKRYKFAADTLYMCTSKEMEAWFRKSHKYIDSATVKEAMENTMEVVMKCGDFEIKTCDIDLPLIPDAKEIGEMKFFRRLINAGLKKRIRAGIISTDEIEKYQARIEEECKIIEGKGFVRYFLIVWELMEFCRRENIMVGPGRGSVGGCLIAWLMEITMVDPIKYNLLFARFINPARADLPDIDADFCRDRRSEVIEHLREVYGHNNVIQITTFLGIGGKMALQDVGRVFGVPKDEINLVTSHLEDNAELSEEEFANSEDNEIKRFYLQNPDIVKEACKLQGGIRGYGKHAAGVCISNKPLLNSFQCNLAKRSGSLVANWDKRSIERQGLLKLDVLGLSALTRVGLCLEMVKESHGKSIDLNSLVPDDQNVFRMLTTGQTEGIFQLGTRGITRYCQDLKINSFVDIYNATALFRPGTLSTGVAKDFVERKHGKKWRPIHKKVAHITESTYGYMVYQEQAMMVSSVLAGMSAERCEYMRKTIGKKLADKMADLEVEFVEGCQKTSGLKKEDAKEIFDTIAAFAKYSFNLSHAVSYSILSYYDAYLKHYFPHEFYASCLSILDLEKQEQIINAVVAQEIVVMLPKIGISKASTWVVKDSVLYMPFTAIIGIGEKVAQKIEKPVSSGIFASMPVLSIPSKFKKILDRVHSSAPEWSPTYDDLRELKEYFQLDVHQIFDR